MKGNQELKEGLKEETIKRTNKKKERTKRINRQRRRKEKKRKVNKETESLSLPYTHTRRER